MSKIEDEAKTGKTGTFIHAPGPHPGTVKLSKGFCRGLSKEKIVTKRHL